MNHLLSLKIPGPDGSQEIVAPSGVPSGGLSGDGGKIITAGIAIFLVVAILLSLGFLVYGGLNWIMSGGDKTKVESARKTIIYAIIGLVICMLSFFIITLIGSLFNLDLLHPSL